MTRSRQRPYLLDVNVLVALTNPNHVHHGTAHEWFAGIGAWSTCPVTESAFVRLMLNPLVAGARRTSAEVLAVLRNLRALPGHAYVADNTSFAEPAIDLAGLQGYRQVTDLHLVNLAARSGNVFATFDAKVRRALVAKDRKHCHVIGANAAT